MAGIPATITVGGIDVTNYVNANSINWKNTIARTSDTLSFRIEDRSGELAALSLNPEHAEVLFQDETGTRLFGGTIKTAKQLTVPRNGEYVSTWNCSAVDFAELLSRGWVTDTYENMTDAEIIQSVMAEYRPDINATTYVETSGTEFERFVANRIRPREVLDNIAKATGYTWYVDANKNLHYFAIETYTAPFGISGQPDEESTFAPIDLEYSVDTTNLCNRITVVGGTTLGTDETFVLPSNLATWADLFDFINPDDPLTLTPRIVFTVPYSLHPPDGEDTILVYGNTGDDTTPVWQQYTVLPDALYPDDAETASQVIVLPDFPNLVFYSQKDKRLRFLVAQPNGLEQCIKVVGRYEIPLVVRRSNYDSNERYGDWFDDKVVDAEIRDMVTANALARTVLLERAYAKELLTFDTYEHGLRAGQTLSVFDEDKGINADFLIQSVSPRIDGADLIRYRVEAGERNPDLIDLFIDIRKRQFRESDDSANVRLSDIQDVADRLELTEAFTTFAVTLSAPWFYSPGAQDGEWNRAKWGAAGPGPNAPTGITGTVGNGTLTFDWADQADAIGFHFETGSSPSGPFTRQTDTFIRPSAYPTFAAPPGVTYVNVVPVGYNAVEGTPAVGSGTVPINLVRFSQELDNALWVKSGLTVTANAQAAPDGTMTAENINLTGFTSNMSIRQRINVTAGQQYTFSWYAKTTSTMNYGVVNVNTGANIVASTSYVPGSAWARTSVTFTVPVGCTQVDVYPLRSITNTGFAVTMQLWGAQLETGATANTYQTVQ